MGGCVPRYTRSLARPRISRLIASGSTRHYTQPGLCFAKSAPGATRATQRRADFTAKQDYGDEEGAEEI